MCSRMIRRSRVAAQYAPMRSGMMTWAAAQGVGGGARPGGGPAGRRAAPRRAAAAVEVLGGGGATSSGLGRSYGEGAVTALRVPAGYADAVCQVIRTRSSRYPDRP